MTRKRKIIAVAALPVLAVLAFLVPEYHSAGAQKRGIEGKTLGANRIIIDPNTFPCGLPTILVSGKAEVDDLLKRIEFEPAYFRWHCRCLGEVAFRFHKDDRELVNYTLHHGQSLRLRDANWAHNPNMQLTPKSQAAVAAWLHAHGYRPTATRSSAPE